jgi:hypothetical protein
MGWFQNALLNIPRAQISSTRLCAGRSPPTSRVEQPTKFDLMVNPDEAVIQPKMKREERRVGHLNRRLF